MHSGDVTWAPSGLLYYDSDKIPELKGKFLVAALRGQHVMVLDLDLENNRVNSVEKIFQDESTAELEIWYKALMVMFSF